MSDLRLPVPMDSPLPLGDNRPLGSAGTVDPVAFGCWRLTGDHRSNTAVINAAVDAGMNLIDNADVYGLDWGGTHFGACEEALGKVLAQTPGLRDRIVLATKGGIVPGVPYDSSCDYLVSACEASLRRLGVDHIDLYQIHRPDHFTHPAEVAEAFNRLWTRGLVREFGVSNFTPAQTRALNRHFSNGLVSTQPEYSALHLDPMRDGTFDLCTESSITPLAWSPLAGGRIATGEGLNPELATVLDELAHRESVTRSAIAVAFVLSHPARPVAIIGTQNPERIASLAIARSVTLSRTDVYRIIQASDGHPLP
jgi:predicted oxidoreductase